MMKPISKGHFSIFITRWFLFATFFITATTFMELLLIKDAFNAHELGIQFLMGFLLSTVMLIYDRKEMLSLEVEKVILQKEWTSFNRMTPAEKGQMYNNMVKAVFVLYTFSMFKHVTPIWPDPEPVVFMDALKSLVAALIFSPVLCYFFRFNPGYRVLKAESRTEITERTEN